MNQIKLSVPEVKDLRSKSDFVTLKCRLEKILKDPKSILIIEDAVRRSNVIIQHTYQFLKLYLLQKYSSNQEFPLVDQNFIRMIMYSVSQKVTSAGRKNTEKNKILLNIFEEFYKNYYSFGQNIKKPLLAMQGMDDVYGTLRQIEEIPVFEDKDRLLPASSTCGN